jgi:hypothetical protein
MSKLECSPSFDRLRTVSKVEPLGGPGSSFSYFSAGRDRDEEKSSAGSIRQVKLKLDTPEKALSI